MYILSKQLDSAPSGTRPWRDYHAYLDSVADRFPPGALALARSEWYHDYTDHRCPHDSWLDEFAVREFGFGPRKAERSTSIAIRLLGAYHDGHIELRYNDVSRYDCQFRQPQRSVISHADWRYDEFRLSEVGSVIHEVEWYHMDETARWIIEAADVTFSWTPLNISTSAPNER